MPRTITGGAKGQGTRDMDVMGLGFATVDVLVTVPRLPQADEVFRVPGVSIQGGGPVATALVTVARLGGTAGYMGAVGGDEWGRFILADFERNRVDASLARIDAAGSSTVSIILVEASTGARSILYAPGRAAEPAFGDAEAAAVRSARILHLDGWNITAAIAAAREARDASVLVSFDGGAGEAWREVGALLPLVDVLVVARQFAHSFTGEADLAAAGPALLRTGAREVVITDGANGCWYWDAAGSMHQPAYPVAVVDTTGAGDVFHGAYIYAILQGWAPAQRLRFAGATAALKCIQPGGRLGIPTTAQVLDFLQERA